MSRKESYKCGLEGFLRRVPQCILDSQDPVPGCKNHGRVGSQKIQILQQSQISKAQRIFHRFSMPDFMVVNRTSISVESFVERNSGRRRGVKPNLRWKRMQTR